MPSSFALPVVATALVLGAAAPGVAGPVQGDWNSCTDVKVLGPYQTFCQGFLCNGSEPTFLIGAGGAEGTVRLVCAGGAEVACAFTPTEPCWLDVTGGVGVSGFGRCEYSISALAPSVVHCGSVPDF